MTYLCDNEYNVIMTYLTNHMHILPHSQVRLARSPPDVEGRGGGGGGASYIRVRHLDDPESVLCLFQDGFDVY